MFKRTITSVVALAIFIPALYFSDTYFFVGIIALASFLAAYEILGCTGLRKDLPVSIPFFIISVLIPMISRLFSDAYRFCTVMLAIMFAYLFYLYSLSVFTRGKYQTKDTSALFALGVYVIFAFASLILLRDMKKIGRIVFLLPYVGAWTTDIFAYICGRLFGKHKLIPEISPKKTVEGMIGGIVFSMLSFVVYSFIVSKLYGIEPNYIIMLAVGAVVSLIAQLGDLVASVIKRQHGIKDFGTILPGHGGVMDRFDSVFAVGPFLFIILTILVKYTTFFA